MGVSRCECARSRRASLNCNRSISAICTVHAEALDQLLTKHIPLREHWMTWVEAAVAMILGLFAIVAVVTFPPGSAALLIFVGCLSIIGVAIVISNSLIWLIDPIVPSIAIVVAAQSAALIQFALVYRQRIAIERRFSQHLSPEVVRQIVANPGELKLAGEKRTVTALLTDIENFTALTERIGPEAVVSLLDRYIDTVADKWWIRSSGMLFMLYLTRRSISPTMQ